MERILVTGGSGFIGTNLIAALSEHGAGQVVNLDEEPPRDPAHAPYWVRGDLRQFADVARVVRDLRPTHVYHLGARTDLHGTNVDDYAANTVGVRNMIEVLNELDQPADVVYASSRLVCRIGYQPTSETDYAPPNPYGESKVHGEQLVRELARHRFVIVRPTSIWGPWFGVPYRDFFDSVRAGLFLSIKGVEIRKSFGYVGNTVHQLQRLMASVGEVHGETLYLGDYRPIEVNAFASAIRSEFGKEPSRQVPVSVLRIAAKVGDLGKRLGWKEPKLTSFRLDNLLTPMVYDLGMLEKVAGALPYSEAEGIRATIGWMTMVEDEQR